MKNREAFFEKILGDLVECARLEGRAQAFREIEEDVTRALVLVMRETRDNALEEAARALDALVPVEFLSENDVVVTTSEDSARVIRALKGVRVPRDELLASPAEGEKPND